MARLRRPASPLRISPALLLPPSLAPMDESFPPLSRHVSGLLPTPDASFLRCSKALVRGSCDQPQMKAFFPASSGYGADSCEPLSPKEGFPSLTDILLHSDSQAADPRAPQCIGGSQSVGFGSCLQDSVTLLPNAVAWSSGTLVGHSSASKPSTIQEDGFPLSHPLNVFPPLKLEAGVASIFPPSDIIN